MPRITRFAVLCLGAIGFAGPALAGVDGSTAWVENHSAPTQCAKFDNVYYTLANPKVRRFEIDVTAPVVLFDPKPAPAQPDDANCEVLQDKAASAPPKEITLFDDGRTRLVGLVSEGSAARGVGEVAVGEETRRGLGLIRLSQEVGGKQVEIVTVDAASGRWRVKPLPADAAPEPSYGTSFLIGPIEQRPRPAVDIARLEIDPEARTFRMRFAKGGDAVVRVRAADQKQVVLDVDVAGLAETDPPPTFAGVLSMFVSPTDADVARVNWRTDTGLYNEPVMTFKGANAHEIRFDRIEASRHDRNAPDVTFRGFQGGPPPPR